MSSSRIPLTLAVAAVCFLAAATIRGQAPVRPPMAEEVFKNVQVLKGIPVDEFMGTMGFFSASLGLNCTDCHVEESGGDWARYADDNALKQMARVMTVMVNTINRTSFGGRQVVTCNTCHRGTSRPSVMPSLDLLYGAPGPDEPGDPFPQAPGQPPPDQILDKYIAAIGGPARVAAFTSFTAKGTYIGFDDADKSPMELYVRAPNQRTTIVHGLAGDTVTTIDGRNGWMAAPLTDRPFAVIALTGQELAGAHFETGLFFPSRLKESLTKWRTGVPVLLNDREVRVVQGDLAGGGVATLCFDAETGLLVRLIRYAQSPVGRLVTRVDYDDYREVAGVRMPFRMVVTWTNGQNTYELKDVRPNVAIDDARFGRPDVTPARP
jgi:hypothetical protein